MPLSFRLRPTDNGSPTTAHWPLKLLHTLAALDPASGGPARSVPQLALALAERGHEVGVWSPGARGQESGDGSQGAGVRRQGAGDGAQETELLKHSSTETPALADLDAEAVGKIRVLGGEFEEALEAFGLPDLVHDHGIWLPCHRRVARVCGERGIPRIVSPRGMLEPWALNHKKWKKRLAWWYYQRKDLQSAHGLHATAESEAEQLRKLGLRAPVVVAANGVAVESAEKLKTETLKRTESEEVGVDCVETGARSNPLKISESQRFSISVFPRTALFLSRIHPIKGLPMLLEAWAKVRPEGWQLRVVGPDEAGHLGELKQLCDRVGLEWEEGPWSVVGGRLSEVTETDGGRSELGDRRQEAGGKLDLCESTSSLIPDNRSLIPDPPCVCFCASLEGAAKWRAMAEADLFILPSHSENFGIVVAEALAAGTPVITTTGTPWEGLHAHECGWWVGPGVGPLTEALRSAIGKTDEERSAMGRRGREWVKQDFAWPGIAEKMEEFYEKLTTEKLKS